MSRYSQWRPEEAVREFGIADRDVFSLTIGPLTMEFDSGLVLGFASSVPLCSVVTWIERDETRRVSQAESLSTAEDLYATSATDQRYSSSFWSEVVGSSMEKISVLKRAPLSVRHQFLPNEVGIRFTVRSGKAIVASCGLHDDGERFSIIPEEMILPSLRPELTEFPLRSGGSEDANEG